MEGAFSRASENSWLTSFSDSPSHLETRSLEETLKKVLSASVATALARYDLPVPGGPYSRMPLQGFRLPGGQQQGTLGFAYYSEPISQPPMSGALVHCSASWPAITSLILNSFTKFTKRTTLAC